MLSCEGTTPRSKQNVLELVEQLQLRLDQSPRLPAIIDPSSDNFLRIQHHSWLVCGWGIGLRPCVTIPRAVQKRGWILA